MPKKKIPDSHQKYLNSLSPRDRAWFKKELKKSQEHKKKKAEALALLNPAPKKKKKCVRRKDRIRKPVTPKPVKKKRYDRRGPKTDENPIGYMGERLRLYRMHKRSKPSKGEAEILKALEKFDVKYIREHVFEELKIDNVHVMMFFDFFIPEFNACIEYDGQQHFKETKLFGKLEDIQESDRVKNEFCKMKNIKLLRIPYTEFDIIEHRIINFFDSIN